MNSAAIGTSLLIARLIEQPWSALAPCCIFATALFVTGDCLFMSKDKSIRLRDRAADEAEGNEPDELQDRRRGPLLESVYLVLLSVTRVKPEQIIEHVAVGSVPLTWYRHTTYDLIAFRLFIIGVLIAIVTFSLVPTSGVVPTSGAPGP